MDMRKIIGFGKSTFIVTLPRKWVIKNKLKKGDLLSISERSMGRLEITPGSIKGESAVKKISIPIENRTIKEVQREFIAAYIKGYSIIYLVGDNEGKVSELRRRLHELVAVEIMEVAPKRITIHVFSDISSVSLPNIISRLEMITKTVHEDTKKLLVRKSDLRLSYMEIMEKKREVDRQSLFAIRIIVKALTDPVFSSTIDTDILKLSFDWHLVEYMGKISDHLLHIAFYLTSTNALKTLTKKAKQDLSVIFNSMGENYSLALRSYNKGAVDLANEVFENHTKNDKKLYSYMYKNPNMWVPVITGFLRRISTKSRDIAKITINISTT